LVQGGNEAVGRAKAILRGDAPNTNDVLNLTSLLDRIGRSLDRLEKSAEVASSDGLHNALAALSGQISRSVEVAARMQNIGYKDTPQGQQGEKFSVNIVLPSLDTAPARHAMIDCTPEPSVPQVTARRNFGLDFGIDELLEETD